jgi:F-type H+-transporting ATPase subunit epsilon
MQFTFVTPQGIVLQQNIRKITLETLDGYYTLLPRHVDFVSALTAGIVTFLSEDNTEKYAACHQGIIVKKGDKITISVQNAVLGETLSELQELIKIEFKQREEQRKQLNTAMARLELGIMRGFKQLRGATDGGI